MNPRTLQTLCFFASAATCSALPLINSSFEAPVTTPNSYTDVTPADWFGIEPEDTFQISIREGLKRSGLQSVAFNAAGTPPGASISQAFATTPGTGYEVAFWTTANFPSQSSVRAEAWDGGTLIKAVGSNPGGSSFNFTETRFSFVATSALTTLTIVDTSANTAGSDLFLDDVSVTELPLPVTLGYWRFEEGVTGAGASSIVDSSGNGHDGTPSGSLFYRDSVPVALIERTGDSNTRTLEFNGTNSTVSIPHDPAIDPTASFTVEFWMRSPGTGSGHDLLVDKSHGFTDNTGWVFQSEAANDRIFFALGTASGFQGVISNDELFDNEWHHLAGTYDGNIAELFVDGVSQGTTTVGTYQSNTRAIRMGNTWQQSRFFAGQLDEVRLSEGVRLPEQLLYSVPVIDPDPDGDGMNALLEAAFLLDPATSDADQGPSLLLVDDDGTRHIGIEYRRQPGGLTTIDNLYISTDFLYRIETSTDAVTWVPAGTDLVYLTPMANGDGSETVIAYLDVSFPSNDARQFLRVTVE